jgi:multicomponent Na+:H+ antiporter subunit D
MEQTGKEYVYELDGMGKKMKISFVCFTIAALSLIGIPLFCGFQSKWRIGVAAVSDAQPLTIAGLIALLLSALFTAIYMLSIVIRAYFPEMAMAKEGIDNSEKKAQKKNNNAVSVDTDYREHCVQMLLPVICFAAGIIILGVFWQPVLDFISFM